MSFQISPGVRVREVDLTTVVPQVSTSVGAVAGVFKWGPLNDIIIIENEDQLIKVCGKPDNNSAPTFFTAANFLSYSNSLRVVRVADETTSLNASADGTGLLVRNDDEYNAQYADGSAGVGEFVAKYPGLLGNTLKVSICPSSAAFSQALSATTVGDKLVGDATSIADLVAKLEVGSILRSSTGLQRSITAITQGTSEALETTGTAVSGSGTAFETTLSVGMLLESAGEIRYVTAIADDENATINASFTADVTPATALPSLLVSINQAFPANLSSDASTLLWQYADVVRTAPDTSDFASQSGAVNDELHVVVIDVEGKFNGIKNEVLERFNFVSKAANAKTFDGSSNYYVDVVNRGSQFVRWTDHIPAGTNFGVDAASGVSFASPAKPTTLPLSGGVDGSVVSAADLIRGYNKFADSEVVDVSLIMAAEAPLTVQIHLINQIAEVRQDCVVFLSPPADTVVNNVGDEANDITDYRDNLPSSSYAVLDSGYKYQYDRHNDVNRYLPLNGDIAGLCARTDYEADPWYSPAGFNRGNIKNVIRLAYSPNQAERDVLYAKGVNPIVSFPGLGTVLYGDKTLLSKPSAFDRINVRRLFNVLKKAIRKASQFSLFEFNDEITRNAFKNLVEPFLRDVQGRRGVTDFRVVCDSSNNTAEVIDANRFIGDIYVKPNRSINYIQLNFVAVRTGVDFSEIVGKI
jgi:hypothetical protein